MARASTAGLAARNICSSRYRTTTATAPAISVGMAQLYCCRRRNAWPAGARRRSLHLAQQQARAAALRQPQRLASACGIGCRRPQQLTQLRRGARIEPAPSAAGQPRDLAECLFGHGIVAFLEHEGRYLEETEFARLGAELVDIFLHGVADEH